MAKFSAGQRVVCIDASGYGCGTLECGKVYEVVCHEEDCLVSIKGEGSHGPLRFSPLIDEKDLAKKNPMKSSTKIPHIHAELIKLWADGAEIECLSSTFGKYMEVTEPQWDVQASYRVKPEQVYPKTTMHNKDIREIYNNSIVHVDAIADVANEAIKHFIVSGDMDKYIESLK